MEAKFSWRTTLGGIISAVGTAIIPFVTDDYKWIPAALGAIGLVLLGGTARDNTVRSSQVPAINPQLKEKQEDLKDAVTDQFKTT